MSKKIGEIIRIGRAKKGFSQKDLAASLGVNPQTVFCWEKNKYAPDGKTLIQLSRLLDIKEELFKDDDNNSDFVPKSEFNKLAKEFNELKSILEKRGIQVAAQ